MHRSARVPVLRCPGIRSLLASRIVHDARHSRPAGERSRLPRLSPVLARIRGRGLSDRRSLPVHESLPTNVLVGNYPYGGGGRDEGSYRFSPRHLPVTPRPAVRGLARGQRSKARPVPRRCESVAGVRDGNIGRRTDRVSARRTLRAIGLVRPIVCGDGQTGVGRTAVAVILVPRMRAVRIRRGGLWNVGAGPRRTDFPARGIPDRKKRGQYPCLSR